jgi:pyruvate,water dikinase
MSAAEGWVVPLSPATADERALGGKAWQLGRLMDRGLRVPEAWAVTTDALRHTIEAGGLRPLCEQAAAAQASGDGDHARAAGAAAAQALREVALPVPLLQALDVARAALGSDTILAARSSAVGEDSADRSHAGQFESVLNLRSRAQLLDGIREVWASWYSDRAIGYRLGIAATPREVIIPPMAVVLQRMIEPRASGILFTVNPVSGDRNQMALEAGPGLGEALAQGRIHPDFFLIERKDLSISERAIAAKDRRMVPLPEGGGALGFEAIPAHRRNFACVTDDEVARLCELGLRAEDEVGCAVDIEWSIDEQGTIYLLQARPVTAMPSHPRTPLRQRPVLWTQRFSGERWTEQATPLGWSIIQPVLHWFTNWEIASERWLDGTLPTRLYRGRPYLNVTIFRHLSFRAPGGKPPQFLLEMFPPAEQQELMRGPHLPNLALVGSIFYQVVREKRWKRYRYNFLTNHRVWEDFRPGFEARTAALSPDAQEPAEALAAIERGRALMVEYMSIHLLSLLFAHLTYEALDRALVSWVGVEGEAIRSALVADPTENRTLQTNKALWELSMAARRYPELEAAMCRTPVPGLDELEQLPGGRAFREEFDRFLKNFGHRSQASYEIFATRWADSPELVLKLAAGYIRSGVELTPDKLESNRTRERAQAQRLVKQRITRTLGRRLLPWRQAVFGRLLDLCRRYMALRENQRFSFDRLLLRIKRIFERLGRLMERDGLLEHGADIVFLTIDEVTAVVQGRLSPEEAVGLVAARRRESIANRDLAHPDFLEADRPIAEVPPARGGRELQGQGVSPGVARGRVRILRSFDEMDRLQAGEVLVARATDPGWTPLFLLASALILELGSVLSHGAVVAREYGLPAVVNVEGATRLLQDGDEVTVDGQTGRIVLHRADNSPAYPAQNVVSDGER